MEDALLSLSQGSVALLVITNRSGLMQVAEQGDRIGAATGVTLYP